MATATEANPKPSPAGAGPGPGVGPGVGPGAGPGVGPGVGPGLGDAAKNTHDSYYGYLFEPNKTPTKMLDALLRAIGRHVVRGTPPLPWLPFAFCRWRLFGTKCTAEANMVALSFAPPSRSTR